MKKLYYLLTFSLVLTSKFLTSQNIYQPINFDHGRWVFISNQKGPFWGSNYEIDTLIYYFGGDTLIESHPSRKLYYYGKSYALPLGEAQEKEVRGYSGSFRNDTANKTLYFGNELIHDYNLSVNDTIKRGLFTGEIVNMIDQIEYCSKQYRRYYLKSSPSEVKIIENIWALDIVQSVYSGPTGNCILACYYEIENSSCQACQINLGIKNHTWNDNIIFPNPTNGLITIKGSNGQKLIRIFKNQGELVQEISTNSEENTIDISSFLPGIYIVKIIWKENISTLKLVKN